MLASRDQSQNGRTLDKKKLRRKGRMVMEKKRLREGRMVTTRLMKMLTKKSWLE